jgi:hypothetical protein
VVYDLFNGFFGSRCPDRGTRPGTQTLSHLDPQLHAVFCLGLLQCLRVRIGNNKINTIQLLVDHVIDRIAASTTHTEYGDAWLECHKMSAYFFCCSRPASLFSP